MRDWPLDPEYQCDVIMKGGITSGVIYPRVGTGLAERYRFRSIGGASAGAIAAGACAAAEYGRVHGRSVDGFAHLHRLPEELAGGDPPGLARLFTPDEATASILATLESVSGASEGAFVSRVAAPIRQHTSAALLGGLVVAIPSAIALSGLTTVLRVLGVTGGEWFALAIIVLGALAAVQVAGVQGDRPAAAVVGVSGLAGGIALAVATGADAGEATATLGLALATALVVTLLAVLVVVAAAASAWIGLLRSVVREVPRNFLGLVRGHRADGTGLTDWLHGTVQTIAGRSLDASPLTFGDLWGAGTAEHPRQRPRDPAIELAIMTTCVTQARPIELPAGLGEFLFSPVELRQLFPEVVVDHLVRTGRERAGRLGKVDDLPIRTIPAGPHGVARDDVLVPMPEPGDIPVVVAMRLSLSFPVLISAVPLWSADLLWPRNRPAAEEAELVRTSQQLHLERPRPRWELLDWDALRLEHCWFSDGGITSNFPIHFFDAPLPSRPTFGVNLREFHPSMTDRMGDERPPAEKVRVPADYGEGLDAWWRRMGALGRPADEQRPTLLGFLRGVLDTLQQWRDDSLLRVAGYRDRVVHVYQRDDEGGLNLSMGAERILDLAERGHAAALLLRAHYVDEPDAEELAALAAALADTSPGAPVSWRNHRWVRLRSTSEAFEDLIGAFAGRYRAASTYGAGRPTYEELAADAGSLRRPDLMPSPWWSEAQQAFAVEVLGELTALGLTWQGPIAPPGTTTLELGFGAPEPSVAYRLRPDR